MDITTEPIQKPLAARRHPRLHAGMKEPSMHTEPLSLNITLSPDLAAALESFIEREHPDLTPEEALRLAFRDWATARGLVPSMDAGLRPEQLNASNDG